MIYNFKRNRIKAIKLISVILIVISIVFGTYWIVNADNEEKITIDFQDEVLCARIVSELKAYKENEDDRANNYVAANTAKSVTIKIEDLAKIKKLNLSGTTGNESNQITNLSGISGFIYLEELKLDNNTKISTNVSSQSNIHDIYKLSYLKVLSLAGTSINDIDIYNSNEIYNISNLTGLKELNISATNISSGILSNSLSNSNNLKKLNLSNNSNIRNLGDIKNTITDLNIESTAITDIKQIKGFSQLESLYMGYNSISDISYIYEEYYDESAEINKLYLPKLSQLNMDNMNEGYKTGNIFWNLQKMNIQSLSLRGNEIYDLSGIATSNEEECNLQEKLIYLDLANNNITSTSGLVIRTGNEEDGYKLYYPKRLQQLILTNNQISDINELSIIDTLQTLKLGNNRLQNISPISSKTFANGQLEIYGQRLSTYVFKDENNSKDYQYMILPNIIQQSMNRESIIYDSNAKIELIGCEWNYDRNEYKQAGNLNVKVPCPRPNENGEYPENYTIEVRLSNCLAEGTVLKYTFEYFSDDYYSSNIYTSQNYDPIETLKFNDSNLNNAIYNYLNNNREKYNIEYLNSIPYIININRGAITQITELDLSNANITDVEGIQNFTEIRKMNLAQNKIKTANQLRYMPYMQELIMNDNQLKNSYNFINNLYELKILNLSSNGITDLIHLNTLYENAMNNGYSLKIEYLYLNSNEIESISILSKLNTLKELRLRDNRISEITELKDLTKIGVLDLSINRISNIEPLQKLINLNKLYLDNNQLTNIDVVTNFNNLSVLAITSNKINDLNSIKYKTMIKELYASDNRISDISAIDTPSHNSLVIGDGRLELNRQKITYRLSNEENSMENVIIALPQIFTAAQNPNSMVYTNEDMSIQNGELIDSDNNNVFDSIKVKPTELNGDNVAVIINGGKSKGTTFTIGQPPIPTLTYTPEKGESKISGNVKVTLTFNREDVSILNNDGKNTYTFMDNGEFTFEYVDEEGFDGTATASVDWLDNNGPIANVQYVPDEDNNTVTVIITTDEPILSVEGWELSDGDTKLTRIYSEDVLEKINIYDKLENQTEVTIKVSIINVPIVQENELTSDVYTINDLIVTGVQPNSTVKNIKEKTSTQSTNVKFYDDKNKELTDDDLIGTASTIVIDDVKIYSIVVTGDTDGNGKANIQDILNINKHRLGKLQLKDLYLMAADVNKDNKISINDILIINKFRLGISKSI